MCIEDAKPAPVFATCARATAAFGSRRRDDTWCVFDPSGSPARGTRAARGPFVLGSFAKTPSGQAAKEGGLAARGTRAVRGPVVRDAFGKRRARRRCLRDLLL